MVRRRCTAVSPTARQIIQDPANDILLSIASIWEMAIKVSIGKLTIAQPLDLFLPSQLQQNSIALLEINLRHVLAVNNLPFHHRDPFDRLLAAQALIDQLEFLSADAVFDVYGVTRQW